MKHFARIAAAAAMVAIVTAMTWSVPAEYTPLLAAEPSTGSRGVAGDAAGYAGRTAARQVAGVVRTQTARRKVRLAAVRKPAKRAVAPAPARMNDADRAQVILAGLVAKHPILEGTTVEMGYAQGYQAICYYRTGRIVVSPTHTATLARILTHEVWHVIDYRDNGRIDWGENVPR